MPRAPLPAVAAIAALALAGCTTDDPEVPAACAPTTEQVLAALDAAPEPVRLDGTPISECFVPGSDAATIQTLGFPLTEASARLARTARAAPESRDALELGYLVGAARRGGEDTLVYDELLRRLEQELQGVDTGAAAFRTGQRAGRETG